MNEISRFLEKHPWLSAPIVIVAFGALVGYPYLDEDTQFFIGLLIFVMALFGFMMWLIIVMVEEAELNARERKVRRAELERREKELNERTTVV